MQDSAVQAAGQIALGAAVCVGKWFVQKAIPATWLAACLADTEIGFSTLSEVFMQRRVFSREFKPEAVKLVTERGVAVAQSARDLNVAQSVPRR